MNRNTTMKYLFVKTCLLSCFFVITMVGKNTRLFAQTPQQNLQKYWDYRSRFLGKDGYGGFIDIGIGPGRSLAASERNPDADCQWDWYLRSTDCKTNKGKGRLHWGDASLYHGFYLAVLALEYANLERAGQKTDRVSKELWYALKTVERLDSAAEILLGYPPALDGFFARDDIRQDFHYKKESKSKRRFAKNGNVFSCISSAASCGTMSVDNGGFISQDQVIGLFIGFSCIRVLLPQQQYQDSLPSFAEMAAANTHRITNYMLQNGWKLKGPDGQKIPDKWGGNSLGLSHPIASIAQFITGGSFQKSYHKKGARCLGQPFFDLLNFSLSFQHKTNVCLAMMALSMMPKRPFKALGRKSVKHDVIIFPLLRSVLFKHKLFKKIQRSDFEFLLNIAPSKGPCFQTKDCEEINEWQSYNRWLHPSFKNGNPYGLVSETPGLDYMLLYNLYHYYYAEDLPLYQASVSFKARQ